MGSKEGFPNSQPWPNFQMAWAPYYPTQHDPGFHAFAVVPPTNPSDWHARYHEGGPPQAAQASGPGFCAGPPHYRGVMNPISGAGPSWGYNPSYGVPTPSYTQPGVPPPQYARGAWGLGADQLSRNYNPALGWNPVYVSQHHQEPPRDRRPPPEEHQHELRAQRRSASQRRPPPDEHQQEPRARRRSASQHGKRRDHHSRHRPGPAGEQNPPRTPERAHRRGESHSSFQHVLRSAGRLTRRTRTPSGTRGEGVAEDRACWSDDGRGSPPLLRYPGHPAVRVDTRTKGRRKTERGERREVSPSRTPGKRERRMSRGRTGSHRKEKPGQERPRQAESALAQASVGPGGMVESAVTTATRASGVVESDMSDLEGNRVITRMNGLLDIWDAKDNPNWEKETFALCDLDWCGRCEKFYAPMRTVRHRCKVSRQGLE